MYPLPICPTGGMLFMHWQGAGPQSDTFCRSKNLRHRFQVHHTPMTNQSSAVKHFRMGGEFARSTWKLPSGCTFCPPTGTRLCFLPTSWCPWLSRNSLHFAHGSAVTPEEGCSVYGMPSNMGCFCFCISPSCATENYKLRARPVHKKGT